MAWPRNSTGESGNAHVQCRIKCTCAWTGATGASDVALIHAFSFEALFVLFLFAGRFKADPRFAVIPVDITALLLVLSMLAGVWVLARRRFLVEADAWQQWLLALAFFAWVLASWYWSPGSEYATQKAVIAFVINLWAMAAAGLDNFERSGEAGPIPDGYRAVRLLGCSRNGPSPSQRRRGGLCDCVRR